MKTLDINGSEIKRDNGSGRSLAQAFPSRRFHDSVIYRVTYNGVKLDNSTVTSINRVRR